MIEAIVAIAMLSIILAAGLVSIRGFLGQQTLAGGADAVVNDLRAAQQLAIARRAPAVITFTPKSGNASASYSTALGVNTVRQQRLSAQLNVTAATVTFTSLGQTPSAVTVTVTDSVSSRTTVITVAASTGAVTVQ
jgi:type II secretory pathway pseudopilin PulG